MANRTQFAGWFNAVDFNYGGGSPDAPPPLTVLSGPSSSPLVNPVTLVLESAVVVRTDGLEFYPLQFSSYGSPLVSAAAPTLVGNGSNQETVTPSSTGNVTSPVPGQPTFTGTMSNLHGAGDTLRSATFGLQEALNYVGIVVGGGKVVIDEAWTKAGGTTTIKNAAVLPTGVTIVDNR